MEFINPTVAEIRALQHAWDHKHKVPERVLDHVAIADKGELISYGTISPIIETVILTNPGASKRQKLEAIKMMSVAMLESAKTNGLKEIFTFVPEGNYAEWLIRRIGFSAIKEKGLILEVPRG